MLLDWDSEFFGFPIARALGSTLDDETAALIDDWCRTRGVGCLYFLADPEDAVTSRVAVANGYRKVDIRVTLRHDLDWIPDEERGISIREANPDDIPSLASLARRSHRDSRFYDDPGFARERCDALYATWISEGVRDPQRWVYTAEIDGAPVGYQLVSPPDDGGIARLEMLAVHQRHRRKGIGRRLLSAGLQGARSAGAVSVETATQARNLVSLETHFSLGFTRVRDEAWHHKWYAQ